MINQLPPGKLIGRMQAPPEWVFSHTARFTGVVRVTIRDGSGFTLVRKGRQIAHYFRYGTTVLCGEEAQNYFSSQPVIEFSLCRYSPEEFSRALAICGIDDSPNETEARAAPGTIAPAVPVSMEPVSDDTNFSLYEDTSALDPVHAPDEEPEYPELETRMDPASVPAEPGIAGTGMPVPADIPGEIPDRSIVRLRSSVTAPGASPESDPVMNEQGETGDTEEAEQREDPETRIISRILTMDGIVAICIFNNDRVIALAGDASTGPLVEIARDLAATARKIAPHLDWGSFVHLTLRLPGGNIIVAPCRDNCICILTTDTINIGHIRRILRALSQEQNRESENS